MNGTQLSRLIVDSEGLGELGAVASGRVLLPTLLERAACSAALDLLPGFVGGKPRAALA